MTIYEVDGQFYTDYDLALLKTMNTHIVVKSHELNETTGLEAHNFEKEIDFFICIFRQENTDSIPPISLKINPKARIK